MRKCDYHIHSHFSDGANSPEEIIKEAIQRGFAEIGFSDHSYTSFDDCCIPVGKLTEYRTTIQALKEKYREQISVLCGIEQDYYSEIPAEGYDYVIGSVHFLQCQGKYYPVDDGIEKQKELINTCFGGDPYSFAEAYYHTVADVANQTNCDIIGHFDLVMKYNEKTKWIDEQNERYRHAWISAADALLASGKIFEWNTGAMSRGTRSVPYPQAEILQYLRSHNAKILLSSDSHQKETLGYAFEQYPYPDNISELN